LLPKFDNRYFVAASISIIGAIPLEVEFLINTCACSILLSLNDVNKTGLFMNLVPRIIVKTGGSGRGFVNNTVPL